LKKKVKFKYNF